MSRYYINDTAQDTGEHEVHKEGCYWLGLAKSTTYLGEFYTCHGAMVAARNVYSNVDGCAHCSPDCHSR